MKRLFLLTIFTCFSLLPIANQYVGPQLAQLRVNDLIGGYDFFQLCINKFPARNIYQLRVHRQDYTTNTCGRHAIKNLIFAVDALSCQNFDRLKIDLAKVLREDIYKLFNRTLCTYLKIRNHDKGLTYPAQIVRAFKGIKNNTFQNRHPRVKQYIEPKTKAKLNKILWRPICLHPDSKHSSLNKSYLLKAIYNFRNSAQKVKGFILYEPNPFGSVGHWICLVVRKVANDFEYFILDSANLYTPYWLKSVQNMKRLMNMPLARLKAKIS